MKLRGIIDNLKIFQGTFNKRPDAPLYFSEKLFSKQQIKNYDDTIKFLEEELAKRHSNCYAGETNHIKNQSRTGENRNTLFQDEPNGNTISEPNAPPIPSRTDKNLL